MPSKTLVGCYRHHPQQTRTVESNPRTPHVAEAGYPEATYNFWVGLFAPSKTPAPIIERIYQETAKALQGPTLKERFVRLGFDAMPLDRPAFAKLIRDEFILNTKVAKAAGVTAN